MKIEFDGQLITTSLTVAFRGNTLQINGVVIDTGSSHTVISPDVLEEIGVTYENGDTIYEAYGIDGSIQIGSLVVDDIEVDVGILPREHKGLLGLDILETHQFVIDLNNLELLIHDNQKHP